MPSARARMQALAEVLLPSGEPRPHWQLVAEVADALHRGGRAEIWLALSVLRGEMPTREMVIATSRRLALEDPERVVRDIASSPVRRGLWGIQGVRPVRVVVGAVIVDVHHTARTGLATGIQRVVRKTIELWDGEHSILLAGWGSTYGGLRELSDPERENALHGTNPHTRKPRTGEVTIPWKSTYILPELAIESERTARIAALAEFSGNHSCVIGFDCVPLTSADTIGDGMGAAFARNLTAVAHMQRVATISMSATIEYLGWRDMLSGAGLTGPDVREVVLPLDSESVSEQSLASARELLTTEGLPLVLCVGSHEPRKNHLAVLQAAETLWARGREFSLVFIGGNSWGSREFELELARLQRESRPVAAISTVTDDLLWSAYRVADVAVFPSLNEGYGLPVAESLSVGTPVVTSDFGSMKEITRKGGAILVNPHDDDDVAGALEAVLFEADTAAKLRAEASATPRRSWNEYAQELWSYFTAEAKR